MTKDTYNSVFGATHGLLEQNNPDDADLQVRMFGMRWTMAPCLSMHCVGDNDLRIMDHQTQ